MGRKERGTRGKEQAEDSFPRDRQGLGLGTQEARKSPMPQWLLLLALEGNGGQNGTSPDKCLKFKLHKRACCLETEKLGGKKEVKVKVGWIANYLGTFHL